MNQVVGGGWRVVGCARRFDDAAPIAQLITHHPQPTTHNPL
jgi:hypothetical protein